MLEYIDLSMVHLQIKQAGEYEPGQQLKLEEIFKVGDLVDVAGTSIGKGFAGEPCLRALASVMQELQFLPCSSQSLQEWRISRRHADVQQTCLKTLYRLSEIV